MSAGAPSPHFEAEITPIPGGASGAQRHQVSAPAGPTKTETGLRRQGTMGQEEKDQRQVPKPKPGERSTSDKIDRPTEGTR